MITQEHNDRVIYDITIDERSLAEDWSRYWIYAPLVRYMTICKAPSRRCNLHIHGWHYLFLKQKQGPLLPNLLALETHALFPSSDFEVLAWSSIFLSSSLKALVAYHSCRQYEIYKHRSKYPTHTLLAIFSESLSADLKQNLSRKYELLPERTMASLGRDEYREGYNWINQLPSLTHLEELSIQVFRYPSQIFDALLIIGQLPLLERLMLDILYEWTYEIGDDLKETYPLSSLPLPLFPSLRGLSLNRNTSHYPKLLQWIWSLKPLVSGLTTILLDACGFRDSTEEFNNLVLQPLCDGSPNLTSLNYVCQSNNKLSTLDIICGFVSQMQLKELKVHEDWITDLKVYPALYQGRVFPHLRRLHLPFLLGAQRLDLLAELAKALPNLEYLSISMAFDSSWSPEQSYSEKDFDVDTVSFQSIRIEAEVHRNHKGRQIEGNEWKQWSIQELECLGQSGIRFLKAIWPNASLCIGISRSEPLFFFEV
ncbi:unnamed protein product [Rhizoctonia solani]|uniref:Uncharacterized protein n=2 Tax=Rhizoctonia solani TaxID=456999 RepID=A0A8H3GSY9_9AGAM|nr:unnamed protein product [Rhizoctonia solani]